jgi:hypothetical protein
MGVECSREGPLDYATSTEHWHHVAGLKLGPCAHVPEAAEPANNAEETGECDCFYVHGTSDLNMTSSNASTIGDGYKTHIEFLRRESTWANGCCKMYAPGYRQFTMKTIYKIAFGFECKQEIEKAQCDIEAAFSTFLDKYCVGDRPFILAGHSQGGMMIRNLIRKRIDNDPALRARLVCAYIAGCPVGRDTFTNVPIASGETDTGCVVTWATNSENNTTKKYPNPWLANVAGVQWTQAEGMRFTNQCQPAKLVDERRRERLSGAAYGLLGYGCDRCQQEYEGLCTHMQQWCDSG